MIRALLVATTVAAALATTVAAALADDPDLWECLPEERAELHIPADQPWTGQRPAPRRCAMIRDLRQLAYLELLGVQHRLRRPSLLVAITGTLIAPVSWERRRIVLRQLISR